MSHDPFDDYLRGNSPLSQAYQALPADDPPPALDAAILAAAHRAVQAQPQAVASHADTKPAAKRRWLIPQSLAATLMIGIGAALILRQMGDEPYRLPTQAIQRPAAETATAPSPKAEESSAPRNSGDAKVAPPPAPPVRQQPLPAKPQAEAPPPAVMPEKKSAEPQPFPAQPMADRQDKDAKPAAEAGRASAVGNVTPAEPMAPAKPAAAPSAPAVVPPSPAASAPAAAPPLPATGKALSDAPADAMRTIKEKKADDAIEQDGLAKRRLEERSRAEKKVQKQEVLSAEAWITRIRQLRDQGKQADAARELKEFRQHYPNYPLPDDLRQE